MTGVKMPGSDLRGALVWRTVPPGSEAAVAVSDMARIVMRPLSEDELTALGASLAPLENGPLKTRLADSLGPLVDAGQNGAWALAPDQQLWQGFVKASEAAIADGYKARLTEYLTRLMCRSRFANGAVAAGVARRAMAAGFKGDMPVLYDKLRAPTVRPPPP